MNIPLAHVQGGEVTGSIDEKVRHAVTKLADLHLVSTERARERVIRMGEEPARTHVTGCPSIDLAAQVAASPDLDFAPIARYGGVGGGITDADLAAGYLVVMQHPVTTEYAAAREHTLATLEAVAGAGLPALWFWPNVDAGSDGTSNALRSFRETGDAGAMHFFKNMRPPRLPAPDRRQPLPGRQLERRDTRGRLLGRARGQHRQPSTGSRARAERGRRGRRAACHRAGHRAPGRARPLPLPQPSMAMAEPAAASPTCWPTASLGIEKRLTY